MPATYATNCGISWDWVEICGRWKGRRGCKIVDRCIDVRQLYQDAKVAAVLCIGGPGKYVLKEDVTEDINDQWLFVKVIPNIRYRFVNDRKLCLNLAKALLYICMKRQSDEVGAAEM